ncbi:hypothetical protein AA0113_g1472 [Alternaria arborescens]|uniref:Azaphilone pigments biosynthesis cluster protein L N-terminal domain-containing protein n=1 Tax=Alternaria arborescens TaxID=156630 RepID=A0A4Q4SPE1_9PLEO|nr:hypothetical protein AA0113_g1472 [Alternaria arborescens]
MAEPLSILASIAGVATAGVAISKMIYEIAHTVKHAPKEVSEMAGELSLLASVLRYLRSALAEYIDVCKSRLIKDIRGTVSKIHGLHRQIKDLTKNSTSSFYRVELLFKSPKTKNLLAQIEGFKNSVSVMLTTVQLAAAKKQLKISKELASKTDVGEIRQLLENLLFANQDSIKRIRREQTLGIDQTPAPRPDVPRRYPRGRSDIDSFSPYEPLVPLPNHSRRRRGRSSPPPATPRSEPTCGWPESTPGSKDIGADHVAPIPQPSSVRPSTRPHESTAKTPKGGVDSKTSVGSHVDPQRPSFVDWDSEKEEEIDTVRLDDGDSKKDGGEPTSTALVPAYYHNPEKPARINQGDGKREERQLKKETGFQILPGLRKEHTQEDPNREYNSEERDKYTDDSDDTECSDAAGSNEDADRFVDLLDGLNPKSSATSNSINHSTPLARAGSRDYRATLADDARARREKEYYGHKQQRTDLTCEIRYASPDDAATWLYRLVFLDEKSQGNTECPNLIQQQDVEVPRTADRLLLQWTKVEPTTGNMEHDASDSEATMVDPDPSWSRRLRSHISRIAAEEERSMPRGPRNVYTNGFDYDDLADNPYDDFSCRHGRTTGDCVICEVHDPLDRDETPGYGPRRRGPSPLRSSRTGDPMNSGASRPFPPDVPYAHYERTEQERAYQTHRNETLTKDIERLESTIRRTEASYTKEFAYRERMEIAIEKQHQYALKSMQDQVEAMKKEHDSTSIALKKQLELELINEHEKRVKSLREHLEKEAKQNAETQLKLEDRWRATQRELDKMNEMYKMKEEEWYANEKKQDEAKAERMEKAEPTRTCLQISTLADREQTWNPKFPSLGISVSRTDGAPSRTSIHGTLCFTKPFLPCLSELYQVLKAHDWQPLWMRGSSGGKTWFLGRTPIAVDFSCRNYMPQLGKPLDQTGAPVHAGDMDDEYAAVGIGLVERDAIDELDLAYKGQIDGQYYRFGVDLTYEDVDSLIATSLLMRERRHRKACVENVAGRGASPSRNLSSSPTGPTPTLDVPRPSGRSTTSQPSRSGNSEERSRRHYKRSSSSRRDL